MARQVLEYSVGGEPRYKVRYRLGKIETSETFRRRHDAEMFRDILGDGRHGRTEEALRWLEGKKKAEQDVLTFADWHETYVEQLTGITPRTRDDYRAYRRRYLSDFNRLPLSLLTRAHIASLVNRLDAEGKSPKTIANVMHHLSSCLELAVYEGHMAKNPCKLVRLPTDEHQAHVTRFLTQDEAAALVDEIPEHYQPFVIFLFGTGLRWSEATALQSRYVDLANGTVRVEQAWKRIKGGQVLGPPKSKKSRRTVNAAVDALVAVEPLLGKSSDYVFRTPRGGIIQYGHFRGRVWAPACERAGLDPRPGVHSTRHSFASWMISDGQSLESVQDQLGHESILTTRKVYGHLQPAIGVAAGKSASAALARVLALRQPRELT